MFRLVLGFAILLSPMTNYDPGDPGEEETCAFLPGGCLPPPPPPHCIIRNGVEICT